MSESLGPTAEGEADINQYAVRVNTTNGAWEVQIVGPKGDVVFRRPCSDEPEARTFASTVQQHIFWLSPAKFEEYYRFQEMGT